MTTAPAIRNTRNLLVLLAAVLVLCMLQVQALRVAATRFTGKRLLSLSLPLSSTSLRSINGEDNNKNQRTPKTGWIHNLPSESSPFWKSQEEESSSSDQAENSKPKKPLRTGWLHNTAPVETNTQQADKKGASGTKLSLARQRLAQAMTQQTRNHQLHGISFPPSGSATTSLAVTEHSISVPLTRNNDDDNRRIRLYFTMVETFVSTDDRDWWREFAHDSLAQTPQQRAQQYIQHAALTNADDMMLYLQGGPGFGAPTPVAGLSLSADGSWAGAALMNSHYQRVVLMDQRGTGQSSAVTKQSLQHLFPDLFLLDHDEAARSSGNDKQQLEQMAESDAKQAVQVAVNQVTEYMSHFRADNIVLDAEDIRDALMLPPNLDGDDEGAIEATKSTDPTKPRPWGASLGQSFGGFCSMTYLSMIEHPPRHMLLTGGIAPQLTPCYDAYCSLWERVRERSLQYYDMYPTDVALVKTIVRKLLQHPVDLPSGGKLTARRFLQLGLALGGSPSSFASLHQLFSSALMESGKDDDVVFQRSFLKQVEVQQSFDDAPFYFWLHESIYGDGPSESTSWAAHRAYLDKCKESSEYDFTVTCREGDKRPVLFFGEMVFPWMSEDYAELQGVGLTAVADRLAQKNDWPPLYNVQKMRAALDSKVRAAAAVYYDDMYVDFDACMQVTKRDGPLEKCKVWISNDYQHSGLRDDGAKIFTKLLGMTKGNIRTPS